MAFADEWKDAKEKFETDTGLKKPTAKGKFLFVSWRKPSGIEDALKDIDKVHTTAGNVALIDDKLLKKWEGLNETLKKKQTAYLKTLDDAIKNEKEEAGKTDQYRHMKVLKATLEAIAARIEAAYKGKVEYLNQKKALGGEALGRVEAVLVSLKTMGNNLKSGVARGTLFCKEVLADPTPDNWNRINSDDGARSTSQPLSNIVKYVYADYVDLLVKGKDKEIEVLDDDRVAEQIRKLNIFLGNMQADIMALGSQTGSSAADGSLAFLANQGGSRLPPTASKQEVIAATKRFAGMLKKCDEISKQLIRFGQ
ncbi:hypothetical protein AYO44_01550 [Planctomycetaceae bacterium SCGC AG-212-F19]|nr:hypothetical protein AYO44_01550 [Planctomycetaceae bacterium SCGC AG-212-F19]